MAARSYVDEPTLGSGGKLRKGRELEPDWAKGLSLDETMSEGEARKLPLDTDPSDIDDPDVRSRFVRRLQHIDDGTPYDEDREPGSPVPGGAGGRPASAAPRGAGRRSPAKAKAAARWFGSPTLTPPRGLSARDGTGFAFGLLLYALGVNFLTNGPAGVAMWLKAKLFNASPTDWRGVGGAIGHGATDPAVIGGKKNLHDPTTKTHGGGLDPSSPDLGPAAVSTPPPRQPGTGLRRPA